MIKLDPRRRAQLDKERGFLWGKLPSAPGALTPGLLALVRMCGNRACSTNPGT